MTRPATFTVGDAIQTALGKGLVREVRNGGRLLVEVKGLALVVDSASVTPVAQTQTRRSKKPAATNHDAVASKPSARPTASHQHGRGREIDLHGLTVELALARVDEALDDALLADLSELRVVHGRSGGRIRAALHQRLRTMTVVRAFRIDPRNEGVTIVML